MRELRNAIERAVILGKGDMLSTTDFVLGQPAHGDSSGIEGLQLPQEGIDFQQVEADLVRQALERTKGNQTQAAKLLHLSRDQLRYRMEKLDLF